LNGFHAVAALIRYIAYHYFCGASTVAETPFCSRGEVGGVLKQRKILIVDDSVSIRAMMGETLRNRGFAVIEAEHGSDALHKLAGEHVDLIVTDLNMPVMDGISLIHQVREQPVTRLIPILMLTTEGTAAKKAEGKAAGATGWIMKPFDPDRLVATIAKVLA
jgi:two-component system chemotaxis response regulator CheY